MLYGTPIPQERAPTLSNTATRAQISKKNPIISGRNYEAKKINNMKHKNGAPFRT